MPDSRTKRSRLDSGFAMGTPLYPSLKPRLVDRLWFKVDTPCDDEVELKQLEQEYESWVIGINN